MRTGVSFPKLATILLPALLSLACSSDDPRTPGPPEPDERPSLFFSPGITCVRAASGADTLLVLNQGVDELVWDPVSVPAWVQGLGDEIRVDPGEARVIRWTWSDRPESPFSDTMIVATNDPDLAEVRIILEDIPSGAPSGLPPTPLLAFPPDSARYSVGDTIFVAWQAFDTCNPVEYRLQISLNASFTQVVCCQDYTRGAAVEVIVDPGDVGRAWWRITPRWAGGASGLPSRARTWAVE